MRLFSIFSLMALVFIIGSCQEPENFSEGIHQNALLEDKELAYDQANDLLIFGSKDYYLEVMLMTPEERIATLASHSISPEMFTSHHDKFLEGVDAIADVAAEEPLEELKREWSGYLLFDEENHGRFTPSLYPTVATLANRKGWVQAGDLLIKYTQRAIYSSIELSVEEMERAILVSGAEGVDPRLDVDTYDIKLLRQFKNDVAECENSTAGATSGSQRVRGYVELFSPFIVNSAGARPIVLNIKVYSEKWRSFWFGWGSKRSTLTVEADGIVNFPNLGGNLALPFSVMDDAHNRSFRIFQFTLGYQGAINGVSADPEFVEFCSTISTSAVACNAVDDNNVCEDCPRGSQFDGANCYFTHHPEGTNGFFLQNGQNGSYTFYYTPLPGNNPCPHQPFPESGFDGANCLVRWGVQGEPFVHNRKFYVKPECPCGR